VPDREDVLFEIAALQNGISESLEERMRFHQQRIDETLLRGEHWLHQVHSTVEPLIQRLDQQMDFWLERLIQRLTHLTQFVHSFDPRFVLKRGYALLRDSQGRVLSTMTQLVRAGHFRVRLQDDEVGAMIDVSEQQKLL
jgi:exonuclease VII large subunit